MAVLRVSGANVLTRFDATSVLEFCLDWMSPAILWEKNSMGSRRIFHIKDELPTMASFPLIRIE